MAENKTVLWRVMIDELPEASAKRIATAIANLYPEEKVYCFPVD